MKVTETMNTFQVSFEMNGVDVNLIGESDMSFESPATFTAVKGRGRSWSDSNAEKVLTLAVIQSFANEQLLLSLWQMQKNDFQLGSASVRRVLAQNSGTAKTWSFANAVIKNEPTADPNSIGEYPMLSVTFGFNDEVGDAVIEQL